MDIIYTANFMTYQQRFCWPSRQAFVKSWINSVTDARREFPDSLIFIYCYDAVSHEFFTKLALPVQLIRVELPVLLRQFWVMAKINTYKIHSGPFLHLDHDVFFENGFKDVFDIYSDSDFVFQQQEGLGIYQHGRFAFETKDGISYWNKHLTRYPNVGIFYCKNNHWAQRLFDETAAFIKRNYAYCQELPQLGLALCLEQQPIGIISENSKCSYLLTTKDELTGVVYFDQPTKRITHLMGSNKNTEQASAGIAERFSYDVDKFDVACWYLANVGIGESCHK